MSLYNIILFFDHQSEPFLFRRKRKDLETFYEELHYSDIDLNAEFELSAAALFNRADATSNKADETSAEDVQKFLEICMTTPDIAKSDAMENLLWDPSMDELISFKYDESAGGIGNMSISPIGECSYFARF